MHSETTKRVLLILFSSMLSLVICIGAYELYASHRHEQWKALHKNSNEWYGGLTIASDNPVLLWEYRPNGLYQDESLGYSIRTNRFGFRDGNDVTRQKPAGILRYAFIGDSITLGLKVKEENTFVARFTELSNQQPGERRLQALNFGVDGYNTLQIAELLEKKVLAFEPDKVLYIICLNDFDFEDASGQKIRFFSKPSSYFLASMSRLYQRMPWVDYYESHFLENKAQVFREIRRMKDMLDDRGVGFETALIPVFRQSDSSFAHYPLAEMHRQIGEELARMNIAMSDLFPVFSEPGDRPAEYSMDEWHPNAKGHRLIATSLYQNTPGENR